MNKENGFTLVELLAVIAVLAIILIIASPQISSTIKKSKLKAMRDSAITIATNAEREYMVKTSKNQEGSTITCESLIDMSDDYGTCTLSFNENGRVYLTLEGTNDGKFDGITCRGTRNIMNCSYKLEGYTDAAEYLAGLCTGTCPKSEDNDGTVNENGMIQDKYGNYRYQGSDPNNYVYFNCTDNANPTSSTCESWRIIGLFGDRVKLVRKDSIGSFTWDDSESSINSGYGINQWGPSTYTDGTPYEGADLMRELNGDYLNSTLSTNANWYVGSSIGSGNFKKNYVLKESAQELIEEATWYLGGIPYSGTITLADAYAAERGTQGKMCTSGTYCTDEVTRTYTWIGKVGLIYPSDFGYASGNTTGETLCSSNISFGASLCGNNWMSSYGWTISPSPSPTVARNVWYARYSNNANFSNADCAFGVHPSVYLIPGVQMKGSGTIANPYVFAE